MAYAERMEAVRAINVLDQAQAALFPRLRRGSQQRWWAAWLRKARGRVGRASIRNVNEVKRWLGRLLGAGFSTD